ncbi:sigma-70 family RNA polymerase sigma factor [Globicatella sanguinis]|uniref:sigma-70 family RNA polymerase sigma factor n=1 Tax=Globicatella sanguinis TaxID=13076 RepID=UPI0025428223|nr:sigma-70 family RNA polymerase sigma factor [Globicatella sanguinis]MDK7631025.1 sigma-70 family RNA polymerase sigma factor [Globicatella sanguinis]WIK65492.1 sigma-70 family RNA polymerase sigma factor [Globicatella sanguinis]WKT54897.1 sigma-70 family RNA polymerase sigma factor [Globicatella sanguinis]
MRLDYLSNEELVVMLQAEFDDEAFNELFYRFTPLYRKCFRQYPIMGFELDDYFQEGRIALMLVIEHYDIEGKYYVASYFARIYENRLINYLRKIMAKKREKQLNLLSLNEPVSLVDGKNEVYTYGDLLFEEGPDTLEWVIAKDALEQLIEDLSELEKMVFIYRMMEEDNSVSNIAKKMNEDRRVIENALARCRKKCRQHFR